MENKDSIFLKILEDNKRLLYKVAHTYCANAADREDLVQEIIIQLWHSFDKYDSNYKLSTWMYRIALNTAISFYRKHKSRNERATVLSETIEHITHPKEEYKPDDNVKMLHSFINQLKDFDKAIILMYLEGLSQKQIAEVVGISSTNAGTKISRIKKSLKRKFDKINRYE